METGKVFNGMQYRVTLETSHGTTATEERNDPGSYVADLRVQVRIPKPHQDLATLSKLNPRLPELLPDLPQLVETSKVSPAFDNLYRLKVANLQNSLNRLDLLISRHNFYDTETILELEHPETKRRALLVQSDMDVDSDGSDSDRTPEVDGVSATFQPFTSYRWPKKTTNPNSFITPRETKLKQIQQELAAPGVSAAKQQELKATQTRLRSEVDELKRFSYLVGALDPFIVLPGSMFTRASKNEHSPTVGDFCVVIHEGVIYPGVVGDVGPTYKSGEGSLLLCKQLNARADVNNRPVSELKVTYLVFPGTSEKPFDVPDLEKWYSRCDVLLKELGGYTGELFRWQDLQKKPAAEVPPTPAAPTSAPATSAPASTPPPATPAPSATPAADRGKATGAEKKKA